MDDLAPYLNSTQNMESCQAEAIAKLKAESDLHGISYHHLQSEEICDFDVVAESELTGG